MDKIGEKPLVIILVLISSVLMHEAPPQITGNVLLLDLNHTSASFENTNNSNNDGEAEKPKIKQAEWRISGG